MVGLPIAAALGALGGDAKAGLEVLKDASAKAVADAKSDAGRRTCRSDVGRSHVTISCFHGRKCIAAIAGHVSR